MFNSKLLNYQRVTNTGSIIEKKYIYIYYIELHIGISKNPSERFHDLNISTRKFQGNVIGKNLGE